MKAKEKRMETALATIGFNIPESADEILENFGKNMALPEHKGIANLQVNGNSGEVTFGLSDREEVDEGAAFVVDVASFIHGYRLWLSKPDGAFAPPCEVMAPEASETLEQIKARLPSKESLLPLTPSNNGDWKEALGFRLLGISGNVTGTAVEYVTDARGAIGEIGKLVGAIKRQRTANPGAVYPVVRIVPEAFTTKKFKSKTSYKPTFRIVEFVTAQQLRDRVAALAGGESPEEIIEAEVREIPTTTTKARRRA